MALTRSFFPLTRLAASLILIHCIILMIGGHYTYALVPLGDWVKEAFDQSQQPIAALTGGGQPVGRRRLAHLRNRCRRARS